MASRRDFLKLGAAAAAVPVARRALARDGEFQRGGRDFMYWTGSEREALPTACALCVSRCPALAYVERNQVVKIEGHPDSIRTRGKLCARGQAGRLQIYDPDRILYPLRRQGARGAGQWKRITWDEALDELVGRLKKLRDDGHPERFMFHHGWISASADRLINQVFLPTYGTGTVANQTCLGQSGRRTAHELTWGMAEDNWDFDKTQYILNFGSNVIEAHVNHVALAHRLALALSDRRVRMVTFDVRLSNTASKSTQWVPIKPGTDLAVVLAMCNVVMTEDLFRGAGEEFLRFCRVSADLGASVADKVKALKEHLAPYTPEWAEKISGVAAKVIHQIALDFATAKPACVISSRGAVAHHNGVETERAIQMLAAITGNIDNPGGRCQAVAPRWVHPTGPEKKPQSRKLDILDGFQGQVLLPAAGVGHQVFKMIKDGRAGRPEVYAWYVYNPVYSNGEMQENIDVLKDESLIPFTVCVTPFYDESAALADLILPDATYLETYDFEDGLSANQIPEYTLRQPVVEPLGEARDFKDVCIDLAQRLGMPLGFKSAEEFVSETCRLTPDVEAHAGGFAKMKQQGIWHDPNADPLYHAYREDVGQAIEVIRTKTQEIETEGVLFDDETGVWWNWGPSEAKSEAEAKARGYTRTPNAFKGYLGQRIGATVYAGFKPGFYNKTGYFEIYSGLLKEKGRPPLPTYTAVPEVEAMKADELVLTTHKVNVQTLSRTQNCKWLDEIHHDNAAWINSSTAAVRGIADGDRIAIRSSIGEIETTARVTETILPGVVAIAAHGGRWQYGRFASDHAAPFADPGDARDSLKLKWWKSNDAHPNWIIPNRPDPISGQLRWMDTLVTITKIANGGGRRPSG